MLSKAISISTGTSRRHNIYHQGLQTHESVICSQCSLLITFLTSSCSTLCDKAKGDVCSGCCGFQQRSFGDGEAAVGTAGGGGEDTAVIGTMANRPPATGLDDGTSGDDA